MINNCMRKTRINYNQDGRVHLDCYIHEDSDELLPAIISLPGGAFGTLVYSDKEPTAMTFYTKGFHSFVLNYSVGEYCGYPHPLDEVSWAIMQIRRHAKEWHIDHNKIILMGFSAGSTVAGMSATQWNDVRICERIGARDVSEIMPTAAIIGYGACDITHTILDNPNIVNPGIWGKLVTDRTKQMDFVYYIDQDTKPMFIWHPYFDQYVPKENPIRLANALKKTGIPYELHMYSDGYHGMSVSYNAPHKNRKDSPHPDAEQWVSQCIDWLNHL